MRVTTEHLAHPAAQHMRSLLAADYVARYGAHDLGTDDPSDFTSPRGAVLIGWADDLPVATISIRPGPTPGSCEWVRGYIAPDQRGRGHLHTLLQAAAEQSAHLEYRRAFGSADGDVMQALNRLALPWRFTTPIRSLDDQPGCRTATVDLTPTTTTRRSTGA